MLVRWSPEADSRLTTAATLSTSGGCATAVREDRRSVQSNAAQSTLVMRSVATVGLSS